MVETTRIWRRYDDRARMNLVAEWDAAFRSLETIRDDETSDRDAKPAEAD